MKRVLSSGLVIGAMISLVGCGGGSSDSSSIDDTLQTVTGQFVDTYVSGLNYACSSGTTGITDNMGYYTCNEGDTVEFSLGDYLLGNATASAGIVTPETLYPDNPEAALNVAQLIQSLDTDSTDDIITIPEGFSDLDDVTVTPEDANFDALIEAELSVPLVSEEEAEAHLDETGLMLLLAGKTVYLAEYDDVYEYVFNVDMSSITWTELLPVSSSGSGVYDVTINGDELTVTTEEGPVVLTLADQTDTYLEFNVNDSGEPARFYFDQTDAEAYYNLFQSEPIAITQTMLDGKTFYHSEYEVEYSEEVYAKMTFSGGVVTRTEIYSSGILDTYTYDYTITTDGKIRIDIPSEGSDPSEYIYLSLVSETAEFWILLDEEDTNQDGTIDDTDALTLYLSKPDDYPANL